MVYFLILLIIVAIVAIVAIVFYSIKPQSIKKISVLDRYQISKKDKSDYGNPILTKSSLSAWSGSNPLKITLFDKGSLVFYDMKDEVARVAKISDEDFSELKSLIKTMENENIYCYDELGSVQMYGTQRLYFYHTDTEYNTTNFGEKCTLKKTESYTKLNEIMKKY